MVPGLHGWDRLHLYENRSILIEGKEWEHRLRSSLYPFALGVAYQAFGLLGDTFFPPVIRTQLLLAPPKLFGAFCAALMEYYTWKLSGRIFGAGSVECTAVVWIISLYPHSETCRPNAVALAHVNCAQSMAMVRIDTYAKQLPGNHFDSHCLVPMALELVQRQFCC